jgi:hypothetical protein
MHFSMHGSSQTLLVDFVSIMAKHQLLVDRHMSLGKAFGLASPDSDSYSR